MVAYFRRKAQHENGLVGSLLRHGATAPLAAGRIAGRRAAGVIGCAPAQSGASPSGGFVRLIVFGSCPLIRPDDTCSSFKLFARAVSMAVLCAWMRRLPAQRQ